MTEPPPPVEAPVSSSDVIRDVVIFGGGGLLFGLLLGPPGTVARAVDDAGPVVARGLIDALQIIVGFPLGGFPILLVLAVYGFGALFFHSGPERGLVRALSFGLLMMAGRVILMP